MTLVNTHRKCLVCQTATTDLSQVRCKCGRYMHLVGFIYQPTTVKESVSSKAQAS